MIETNVTGAFLCTQEAFRIMKRQDPSGRADHQQRLDLGERARGRSPRPTRPPSTPSPGLTKSTSLDGRAYDIACGQIDIGNAATELTESRCGPTGRPAAGRHDRPEPTIDVADVARAVVYMATLPLDANVQFMTVMATKMPFVGRG